MADNTAVKQYFKDASDDEAKAMFQWATAAMEVRGLIPVAGLRRKRSDAGQPRKSGEESPAAGDQLKLREGGENV